MKQMKNTLFWSTTLIITALIYIYTLSSFPLAHAKPPPTKSKFYDFNEQIIDGEIRKPTATYIDSREKAKFERLLKLKKSFMPELFKTHKNKVFK